MAPRIVTPRDVPADIEDPAQLQRWARQAGLLHDDERAPEMSPLTGGVSSRVMLVTPHARPPFVVKQALQQLRVQVAWTADPARIHVEAAGMVAIGSLCGDTAVPKLLAEDEARHVIAMEYVSAPAPSWKSMLLAGAVDRAVATRLGEMLAQLHVGSAHRLAEFEGPFGDRSIFERLRVEPFYLYTAAKVPEAGERLSRLATDVRRRHVSLVHGDFSPKNVLVADDRIVLLDHEVLHIGDPAFDLGFFLAHLLTKYNVLAELRSDIAALAAEFWKAYRTGTGQEQWVAGSFGARTVEHTLACLLARVAGRSPADYLDENASARQRAAVLQLHHVTPGGIDELIAAWGSEVS